LEEEEAEYKKELEEQFVQLWEKAKELDPYKDINIIAQDTQLPFFKFPYLNNPLEFINKILVITPSLQFLEREY